MEENFRQVVDGKKGFICDMDGVIYHGNRLLPGAKEFVQWLNENGKNYLFLTNSSERSPRELSQKLARLGLDVGEEHFYTSAIATASFLATQKPGGSAYIIGEAGLINAMYAHLFRINDYTTYFFFVVQTPSYSYDKVTKATRLVLAGAKLIGTNPDVSAPGEHGILPATKAIIAPIELTSGKNAYYIGKPNPLMMRHAIKLLNVHHREAIIIGDRMDTDIIAGLESEIATELVLSGVSSRETVDMFPYSPKYIIDGIGDVPPHI